MLLQTYQFPLDERSAVHRLEVCIDGVVTRAVVRPKEEARQVYQQAVAQGQQAQLLEEDRADIFQMKLGNVGQGQRVVVMLTYVCDLALEDGAIRFVLPTFVAPRYTPAVVRL